MQHRDRVIIDKVLSEIHIAQQMMSNVDFKNFYANEEKKRAVCMTVINIGELVKNLSHEFRDQNRQVPWKLIAGFRDIAAHKYGTLDMHDVYDTVTNDFCELEREVRLISENG